MKKWTDSFSRNLFGHISISPLRDLDQNGTGNGSLSWTTTPSQQSKVAKRALRDIEAELHEIPPRSPHINVIESIFHLLRMDLEEEAVYSEDITCEQFEQFRDHVLKSLERLPTDIIDRTIESLNDRIDAVISSKGSRTKY